jgi:hypothetical protein
MIEQKRERALAVAQASLFERQKLINPGGNQQAGGEQRT